MCLLKKGFDSVKLARKLNLKHVGKPIKITSFGPIHKLVEGMLSFWNSDFVCFEDNNIGAAIICGNHEYLSLANNAVLLAKNPRLEFIRALTLFKSVQIQDDRGGNHSIDPTAIIHKTAVVDSEVSIGEHTIIGANVIIAKGTSIGKNCKICNGASIGNKGFGYEKDEFGHPLSFPHFSSVIINDNVTVGANSCISKGVFEPTIVKSNVKIDDLVYIAHNCSIDEGVLIISGCTICGGVKIGKEAWLGAGSTICQNLKIDKNSVIGAGAVVLKDVKSNTTVVGNPAKPI